MSIPVVTVASGGLPVVEMAAGKLGLPVTEATNGRGIAVTKVVGKPGLPVVFDTIGTGGGGDSLLSNVKLLLGFNGANGSTGAPGMTDESLAAHGNATVNGASISTAQSVFDGSSLALNGGGYITFADHNDWTLSNQPFTIEFRYRTTITTGTHFIVGQWDGVPSWVVTQSGTAIQLSVTTNGVTPITHLTGGTVAANTWYAVCVDFDGTKYRLYLDGVMVNSSTTLRTIYASSTDPLSVGASAGGAFLVSGFVDELRLTKDTARYASDSGYTVATSAFPRA
jgi:Concanavalin A-like lectin/glucanases superfamily